MTKHLTSEQRYEIYLGLKRGWSKRFIAREINVHPSTVCCEFAAHGERSRALSLKNRDKVIVYFADSYASWQKGAIENTNKFIRK